MSYIVLFNATDEKIRQYKQQFLYPINLNGIQKSKSELLEGFLQEIYDYTTTEAAKRTMYSREGETLDE